MSDVAVLLHVEHGFVMMDFVRCPECQAPLSKKSKSCHRCHHALNPETGVTVGDIGQSIKHVLAKMADGLFWLTSWADKRPEPPPPDISEPESIRPITQEDIEEALREREKQKEPMKCAWLGCLFALIGIFFFALLFVPLAVLFTGAGLIGGVIRFRLDALFISIIGLCLTIAAIMTSPSILLLIGLSASQ